MTQRRPQALVALSLLALAAFAALGARLEGAALEGIGADRAELRAGIEHENDIPLPRDA